MNVFGRKATSQRLGVQIALILVCALSLAASGLCQCSNEIDLVPLVAFKAASKPRDFVRFKYSLSASASLLIRSHEDTETTIGPYDTGFSIMRDGRALESVSLRQLPEMRREDSDFAANFVTVAVSRACGSGGPVFFVAMQYKGDMTSAALFFVIVPSALGFEVSALPMISGGILEVSKANPLHLKTWHNLMEGECNACETAYQVTEYEIRDARPVQTRQYRTRRLYSSGQFDSRRGIRFIP